MKNDKWLVLDLQMFSEDPGADGAGAEDASAAGMQEQGEGASQTGADEQGAADPGKQNNFEKAFAKRLADAQSKWEADKQTELQNLKDQYKDHDIYRKAAEFVQKQTGINDIMSLKEELEMNELQERAAREGISPEVQRRLDQLEAKAARADELEAQRTEEQQQREQQQEQERLEKAYFDNLGEFAKAKNIDGDKLNQFMIDNEFSVNPDNLERSLEMAYKAMKHDELVQQLEDAEKNGMRKLIQSKSTIPQVNGSKAQGQTIAPAPKTLAEARQRAMQRLTSAE